MMVITRDGFMRVVHDELRLPLAGSAVEGDFDQVVNWRSVHLVRLVVAMEKQTGRRVPVGELFEKRTLREMYEVFAVSESTREER